MWIENLTRQQYKDFLVEHADHIIDVLLTTDSYLLDSIVIDDLQEELGEYADAVGEYYWEAC